MASSKEKQSSALPKRKSSRSVGAVRRHAEQKKDAEAAVLVRARKDRIIDDCLNEIDRLPIQPETNKIYRNSGKKIVDAYLKINHWLTKDMIKSKRKRRKKAPPIAVVDDGKKTERQYSQDPNFCNDMNPSGRDIFLLLRKLQQSEKWIIGIEEGIMKALEEVREQREDNRLMRLAAIRLTAGFIAGVGEHDLS